MIFLKPEDHPALIEQLRSTPGLTQQQVDGRGARVTIKAATALLRERDAEIAQLNRTIENQQVEGEVCQQEADVLREQLRRRDYGRRLLDDEGLRVQWTAETYAEQPYDENQQVWSVGNLLRLIDRAQSVGATTETALTFEGQHVEFWVPGSDFPAPDETPSTPGSYWIGEDEVTVERRRLSQLHRFDEDTMASGFLVVRSVAAEPSVPDRPLTYLDHPRRRGRLSQLVEWMDEHRVFWISTGTAGVIATVVLLITQLT